MFLQNPDFCLVLLMCFLIWHFKIKRFSVKVEPFPFWKYQFFLPCVFNLYLYLLIITMATLFNPLFSSCLYEHAVFNDLLSSHFASCQVFTIQDVQTEKQSLRNTLQIGPPNIYDRGLNPFFLPRLPACERTEFFCPAGGSGLLSDECAVAHGAAMWEPADRAKPSHEPHRYDIVMHYLFTRSILRARFLYIYRFN